MFKVRILVSAQNYKSLKMEIMKKAEEITEYDWDKLFSELEKCDHIEFEDLKMVKVEETKEELIEKAWERVKNHEHEFGHPNGFEWSDEYE